MSDEYTTKVPSAVVKQPTRQVIYWRAAAVLVLLLTATALLGNVLISNSAAQPARPLYLKGATLASGVIQSHAQASSSYRADPNIVITDIVPMTMPNSYLGVGSALVAARSGDPNMQVQNFWLSMHSPGVPKENGDPFTAKWDQTSGGCNCWPVGGPFQPNHDNHGTTMHSTFPTAPAAICKSTMPPISPSPARLAVAGILVRAKPHISTKPIPVLPTTPLPVPAVRVTCRITTVLASSGVPPITWKLATTSQAHR